MVSAQTEGDTGYDYNDAYDTEYDDESGQTNYVQVTTQSGVDYASVTYLFHGRLVGGQLN